VDRWLDLKRPHLLYGQSVVGDAYSAEGAEADEMYHMRQSLADRVVCPEALVVAERMDRRSREQAEDARLLEEILRRTSCPCKYTGEP
jgi:DNA-binding transcriptional regulator YbjK